MSEPQRVPTLTAGDLLTFGEEGEWLVAQGHVDLDRFRTVATEYLRDLDYDMDDDWLEPRHRWMRPARAADFPDDPDGWERAQAEDWQMWVDSPEDGAEPITIADTE